MRKEKNGHPTTIALFCSFFVSSGQESGCFERKLSAASSMSCFHWAAQRVEFGTYPIEAYGGSLVGSF